MISLIFALALSQRTSAMSNVVVQPPSDARTCDGRESLESIMAQIRSRRSIQNLSDQAMLELFVAPTCEAARPQPDYRMMALAEAIFVGSGQKKAILFCGDNVRKRDEVESQNSFAYVLLDEKKSGELNEESVDHRVQYAVKVNEGELRFMQINGKDAAHLDAKSGGVITIDGFNEYALSCEIFD